jgi:hypothetical protein
MAPSVEFICAAPVHLCAAAPAGTLTINVASWAFCPSASLTGHLWTTLANAVPIELLRLHWRSYVPAATELSIQASEAANLTEKT